MRIDDHRRQDEAKARRESGLNTPAEGAPGTMQMNGTEYVAITPASTQRGGPLHPSLPTRPQFDIVPKEEPAGTKGKKMTAAQREAASLNAGKNSLLEAQGSNSDIVANRKKIRMANQSAAELLKAELAGETPSIKDETVEVEVEGEEKEEMQVDDFKALQDEQAENEGVDEEIIPPPVTVEENVEEEMPQSDIADEDSKASRGKKRKAEERDEEVASNGDASEVEDPPNPEADQPVSKKKLKINPDGTVEGYTDDVR